MRKWILFCLILILAGCSQNVVVLSDGTELPKQMMNMPLVYMDEFNKPVPDMWAPADPSAWEFTKDGNRGVYSQARKSKYRPEVRSPFGISVLKDICVSDFVMDVWMRSTVKNYPHRDMVVAFGYQDPSHFYYTHFGLKADQQSNTIHIVNGQPRRSIAKTRTKGTPWTDGYHHVRIIRKVEEGIIEAYFDDMSKPAMTAEDKTFKWGRIGVGTFDDTGNIDQVFLWGKEIECTQ